AKGCGTRRCPGRGGSCSASGFSPPACSRAAFPGCWWSGGWRRWSDHGSSRCCCGPSAVRSGTPRVSPEAMRSGRAIALISQAWILACGARVETRRWVEPVSGRPYTVLAPKKSAGPPPVLFALHAHATDPMVLVRSWGLGRRAVAGRGWVLVVPEGLWDAEGNRFWNASAACCGTGRGHAGDLDYLHGVLE